MITRIGIVAGEIWNYLERHNEPVRMEDIVKDLGKGRDLVMMSLGWLAREGHIVLEMETPNYMVRLTSH
ncbi:MAG: winged helix-turn-helix domain-containing protein [Candidatus Omnitrophota bacterium]